MGRWFSLVLVITSLAAACAAQTQPQAPCMKLRKIRIQGKMLHQGSDADVTFTLAGKGCRAAVSRYGARPDVPTVWVQAESGPATRLAVSDYESIERPASPTAVLRARVISVSFRVKAAPDTPLGTHDVPVSVTYLQIDESGRLVEETLQTAIPVRIGPPAKPRGPSFLERHPNVTKALTPVFVAALIALTPIIAVMGLLGIWDGC